MIAGGCDIGSSTSKAVILDDGELVSQAVRLNRLRPAESAKAVLNEALQRIDIPGISAISRLVSTGYGRMNVDFAQENVSEITCLAKGVHWSDKSARTIIDIGGQDVKVVSIDEKGSVRDFAMNDKCAAGTGKFLENIARALGLSWAEMSALSAEAEEPVHISSQCSVFAESEVVSLLNENVPIANIVKGIFVSVAKRVLVLGKRLGLERELVIVGGASKSVGLRAVFRELSGIEPIPLSHDPQVFCALGAAVIAATRR